MHDLFIYLGGTMSDLFSKVTGDQDIFKKILAKVPGFSGYIERQNRRASDKLLREVVASRFEEQWQRISGLQSELSHQGGLVDVGKLESAAIKIRQFINRIRTASYGYSGLFDAVKVNEDELAQVYQYDLTLLQSADELSRAVDNIETAMGSEGLPAAIRHLTSLAAQAVAAFNKRSEVMMGGITPPSQ
jgi:hypothetical protein